jgi:hypothetical protein
MSPLILSGVPIASKAPIAGISLICMLVRFTFFGFVGALAHAPFSQYFSFGVMNYVLVETTPLSKDAIPSPLMALRLL